MGRKILLKNTFCGMSVKIVPFHYYFILFCISYSEFCKIKYNEKNLRHHGNVWKCTRKNKYVETNKKN